MTAATRGPSGPEIFSLFSQPAGSSYRVRREAFLFSMLAQSLLIGLLSCVAGYVIRNTPETSTSFPRLNELPLIFSGRNGGGGGNHDPLPASSGDLPLASLSPQIVPPTVILPKEMPKVAAPETVMIAPPEVQMQGGPIGDPLSRFTSTPSNGPGGPGGIGSGCCDGVGPSAGPGAGEGPPGIWPAGRQGVTAPVAIYHPEPNFSEEARETKTQGRVGLILVVGKDGQTYDIRVQQSLGMGLDEKAIEAVTHWRFKPATLNGLPVATQIAVELDFHLY